MGTPRQIEARGGPARPRGLAALVPALLLALAHAAPAPGAGDPFLRQTVTVRVVEEAGPAVVNITTQHKSAPRTRSPFAGDPLFERFFRDFFEPRLPQTAQSLGSGVVIDAEGHILTNAHVVSRAERIRVAFADGRELDAERVGADPNNDIAVLRVTSEEPLPWIPMGRSDDLRVGEPVIAIGNPFGLSNTVTTGVVSAINRSIRSEAAVFHGFLQTDAAINPGNSGGALLNAAGELIAINTAVYQGGQGIGFAIPIDTAARVVRELIEEGEIAPVWLGIDFQDLTPALQEALGLPPGSRGALVNKVRDQSPAARARLRRGDVVTRVGEIPIHSARDFFAYLETVTQGQTLSLEFWRDGEQRREPVVAEEIPDAVLDALVGELLGMELDADQGGGYRVRKVDPGSGAARIGIQEGDRILAVDGRALEDPEALRRATLELRGRGRVSIVVQRGRGRYHVMLPLV